MVPAAVYVLVIALRILFHRPRPFEQLKITPLVPHGKGKSFPSRHVASAVIIAMGGLYLNFWLGAVLLLFSFVLCLARVMARGTLS